MEEIEGSCCPSEDGKAVSSYLLYGGIKGPREIK